MKTKYNLTAFIAGLILVPSFLFGQGIIISSNAYVVANSGYVVVTGNMANSGTLNLQTGSFTMSGNYTNSGTYAQGSANMVFNGSTRCSLITAPGRCLPMYFLAVTAVREVLLS